MSNNTSRTNHTTSKELKARIARASLLEKYHIAQNESGQKSCDSYFIANISSIMEELETTVATCSLNERENIIQLQLSDIVDKFIRTLKQHEQIIYIRRYFYADTVENIAASCDLSADKIRTIINKCNENLNATLKEKNHLANTESLFQCFADIHDDLISFGNNIESINDYLSSPANKSVKKLNMHLNKYTISIAAIFVIAIFVIAIIVIIISFPLTNNNSNENNKNNEHNEHTSETSDNTEEEASNSSDYGIDINDYMHIFGEDEDGTYVITHKLLEYGNLNSVSKPALELFKNNCSLTYYAYELTIDKNILKYCKGSLYEYLSTDIKKYYQLLGHDDFQFIIQELNGEYTLFKLFLIKPQYSFSNATFEDTLYTMYGIKSADDIEKILIAPMSMDLNFDFEPETLFCVDDHDSMAYTYNKLKDMSFSTTDTGAASQYGTLSHSAIEDLSMRFIIYTKKGGLITSLCYNFSEHYFYEANGTKFSKLYIDSAESLDEIFHFSDIINNAEVWNPDVHKLSVDAHDVTNTNLRLYYKNYNTPINGLYVSSWYHLEQLVDDTWVSVTPEHGLPEDSEINIFQDKISENSSGIAYFNWYNTYGPLPAGQYRIITSVCNLFTYNTQNHVEQLYYTEFTVK